MASAASASDAATGDGASASAIGVDASQAILNDDKFRNALQAWIALDDSLKAATNRLKPARKKHRLLKTQITEYMRKSGRSGVLFNDRSEQITVGQRERVVKLDDTATKARIRRAGSTDADTAAKIYEYLYTNPEKEQVETFSRKNTDFGRKNSMPASELARVDLSTLTDPRDVTRVNRLRLTYNEMQESVRNNKCFEF